jgi:fumarylacetoacetate (FAA) hydrolase
VKLATLRDGTRDGRLILVSRDLAAAAPASAIAPTLQAALENWSSVERALWERSEQLDAGTIRDTFRFDPAAVTAPLPRAYQWCDASAFMNHGKLMTTSLGTTLPPDAYQTPLMYQGGSDDFLGPCDDVPLPDESHGIDFEGEYGVILDDVPMSCSAEQAVPHVKLVVLVNDLSLRAFSPREVRSGFGFFHAKPSTSFGPVAVTPDELGGAWRDGRVHLPLEVSWNGERFGSPNGREMSFSFFQLVAHAAFTRRLRAGTIVGSGTVSNADRSAGSACISERRAIEMIDEGAVRTEYMRFGDRIRMEACDENGRSVFGAIDQRIVRAPAP